MMYSRCLSCRSLGAADVCLTPQCSAFSARGKSWAANIVCTALYRLFHLSSPITSCFVPCPQTGGAVCSTVPPSTVLCSQSCAMPTSASVQKVRNDCTSWSKGGELLLGTIYMGIVKPRKYHRNYPNV